MAGKPINIAVHTRAEVCKASSELKDACERGEVDALYCVAINSDGHARLYMGDSVGIHQLHALGAVEFLKTALAFDIEE